MLKIIGYVLVGVVVVAAVALLIVQKVADGPMGPLQGGVLRSGALVTEPDVDWAELFAGPHGMESIELQLVDPATSRITGAFEHNGELYIPCDLGFVWRRAPDASSRMILRVIWLLKSWHTDALADGRAVVRIHGKRYERHAVRVTDTALLAAFRGRVQAAAEDYLGSLLPVQTSTDDIWFFRMAPPVVDQIVAAGVADQARRAD